MEIQKKKLCIKKIKLFVSMHMFEELINQKSGFWSFILLRETIIF